MMVYRILLQNENRESIAGEIELYSSTGDVLGVVIIPIGGADVYPEDIPDGTTYYKFLSAGYGYYGTSVLYDSNTITLIKETSVLKYFLLGSLGAAVIYGLSRWLK